MNIVISPSMSLTIFFLMANESLRVTLNLINFSFLQLHSKVREQEIDLSSKCLENGKWEGAMKFFN